MKLIPAYLWGMPAECQMHLMLVFFYRILTEAFEEMVAFQEGLKSFVGSVDTQYGKKHEEFFIGLEGR